MGVTESIQERNAKSVLAEAMRLIREYQEERRTKDVEMRSNITPHHVKGSLHTYEDTYNADLDAATDHALNALGMMPDRHTDVRRIIEEATLSGYVVTRSRMIVERNQWIRQIRNLSGSLAYVAALAIANGRWARNERRARLRSDA